MKEYRSSLALLDREEAQLLPARETLQGGININTLVGINFSIAIAGIANRVSSDAGQLLALR